MRQPGLSVVIPLHDERDNILPLWNGLVQVLDRMAPSWEVIWVDDGSSDGSLEQLLALRRRDPRARILRLPRRSGQSAAFRCGFDRSRGEIVVTMDADLQNDPEDIPRLVGAIWMADVVVGWRRCRCDPLTKRIASRLANTLRNWLMGESIPDGGCSLKVFRRSALSHFPRFDGLHRFYPTLASMAGLRVEVIPVRHHPRRSGNSKYGISNRLLGPLADLLVVRWMKSRHMGTVECVEIADDL